MAFVRLQEERDQARTALDEVRAARAAADLEHESVLTARDEVIVAFREQVATLRCDLDQECQAHRVSRSQREDAVEALTVKDERLHELDAEVATLKDDAKARSAADAARDMQERDEVERLCADLRGAEEERERARSQLVEAEAEIPQLRHRLAALESELAQERAAHDRTCTRLSEADAAASPGEQEPASGDYLCFVAGGTATDSFPLLDGSRGGATATNSTAPCSSSRRPATHPSQATSDAARTSSTPNHSGRAPQPRPLATTPATRSSVSTPSRLTVSRAAPPSRSGAALRHARRRRQPEVRSLARPAPRQPTR